MSTQRIALVGGTGPQGRGLALRLAMAGHAIVIGSRERARAEATAAAVRAMVPSADVSGAENVDTLERADAVILAIAPEGVEPTLAKLGPQCGKRLIIDVVVPLAVRDGVIDHVPPPGAASAGEFIQARLPGCRVVSAFKNVPSAHLLHTEGTLAGDVLICGDDASARAEVAALVEGIRNLRPVDAGPMRNVRFVEGITALLVNLNRAHRAHTSIRILGLD